VGGACGAAAPGDAGGQGSHTLADGGELVHDGRGSVADAAEHGGHRQRAGQVCASACGQTPSRAAGTGGFDSCGGCAAPCKWCGVTTTTSSKSSARPVCYSAPLPAARWARGPALGPPSGASALVSRPYRSEASAAAGRPPARPISARQRAAASASPAAAPARSALACAR